MKSKRFIAAAVAIFALSFASTNVLAGYKDEIGFTQLQNELGPDTPTGEGIGVTQVEATTGGGNYLPAEPGNAGDDVINDKNGDGTGVSGHAFGVRSRFYSSNSIAPAAGNTVAHPVDAYNANNWLFSTLNSGNLAPATEERRVQNHSYIVSSSASDSYSNPKLRRFDRQLDRDNVISAVGVNNGGGSSIPDLLAPSYNAIAVGVTDGGSSEGPVPTGLDGAGRSKPDIVAPSGVTSNATPMVAASAVLLAQTADEMNDSSDAGHLETIKATLLTGATKDEFSNWDQNNGEPLDRRYGAGELNIANSYHTLRAGQHEAADNSLVPNTGWDFDNLSQGQSNAYFFDLPEDSVSKTLKSLSITATWNREFPNNDFDAQGLLANFDIDLFKVDDESFTLGSLIDQSDSDIDNVEHLFETDLDPGRYAIELSRLSTDDDLAASGDFALAWQARFIPEPTSLAAFIPLVGLLLLLPRRRGA